MSAGAYIYIPRVLSNGGPSESDRFRAAPLTINVDTFDPVASVRPNLGTALILANRRFCVKWRRFTTGHASRQQLVRIAPHESHIERPLTIAPGPERTIGRGAGTAALPTAAPALSWSNCTNTLM